MQNEPKSPVEEKKFALFGEFYQRAGGREREENKSLPLVLVFDCKLPPPTPTTSKDYFDLRDVSVCPGVPAARNLLRRIFLREKFSQRTHATFKTLAKWCSPMYDVEFLKSRAARQAPFGFHTRRVATQHKNVGTEWHLNTSLFHEMVLTDARCRIS